MKNPRKPSPAESPLLMEIDLEPVSETLTAMGGANQLLRVFPITPPAPNDNALYTLSFLMLLYFAVFSVVSARERRDGLVPGGERRREGRNDQVARTHGRRLKLPGDATNRSRNRYNAAKKLRAPASSANSRMM